MAKKPLTVETLTHDEASRRNAPTAELEAFVPADMKTPIRAAYERRNPDLDPQLVWRGKDMADWSDLIVEAPPLYIQEKIHPKALIEDLKRASERRREPEDAPDLFADFNGIEPNQRTEFYEHDQHWSNRMILGDGLKVMASLAEREGLKGQVQCIYIDPPYGIKFNSNFQWSTTNPKVQDKKADHFSREPEQVKAFRDTWADGIHSYLTYLRDRLTVARDLLTETGSVFVQIGDENVHRVRALMDEVFGDENCVTCITVTKTASQTAELIPAVADFVLWYARDKSRAKFRQPLREKSLLEDGSGVYRCIFNDASEVVRLSDDALAEYAEEHGDAGIFRIDNLTSQRPPGSFPVMVNGKTYGSGRGFWKTGEIGMERLKKARRVSAAKNSLTYIRYLDDYRAAAIGNVWTDTGSRVRVAGPFTVESLSPHRVPAMDVDDSLFDELEAAEGRRQAGVAAESADFAEIVLENLKRSGVQVPPYKTDRVVFSSLKPWPGRFICAEGSVRQASEGEGDTLADSPTRRAAILIGPEYGTVARADLTAAAREAMEAGFDLLIAASFNFDAHASEFDRMGALTVLQARINPDLHMPDLANTGAGNLFTVFGEPDIQVHDEADGCISIEVAGVDMYKGGEIVSSDADDIAVWFIDTDYNYESFFVRHAYFPGANDPYKALKTTLKAEIDADAWESLKRTRSRPFPKPAGGKVAVKVINHLGDEVMKVVGV
jgi:hypothetical protein